MPIFDYATQPKPAFTVLEGRIGRKTPASEKDGINTIDEMALLQQRERDKTITEQKSVTEEAEVKKEGRRRKLSPKNQNQKAMEVFMDNRIHEGIKALSVVSNITAKDYVEQLLVKEVEGKDDLVKEGIKYLGQADGNVARAKYLLHQEKLSYVERLEKELAASRTPHR